ncbi:MAG: class I SAM-dependent methyltransferase, partial [bacterium]|nr:class I SAM-dependent methyltransferase [bacterium]
MTTLKDRVSQLLEGTGISINGSNPWDIRVMDERLYARVLAQGSLGLGEAYMDGWWDCAQMDEMLARVLNHKIREKIKPSFSMVLDAILAMVINRQQGKRAFEIGEAHYDAGNDLYRAMLDKRMVYTCGYWKSAQTLDEAQEAKLDLVCRKIGLKAGQRVFDIGCGW